MTPFYKIVDENGNIPGFGTCGPDKYEGLVAIKEEEYRHLLDMMKSRPDDSEAKVNHEYILHNDPLKWIEIEMKKEEK